MRELFVNYTIKFSKPYSNTSHTVLTLTETDTVTETLDNFTDIQLKRDYVKGVIINNIYLVETKDD